MSKRTSGKTPAQPVQKKITLDFSATKTTRLSEDALAIKDKATDTVLKLFRTKNQGNEPSKNGGGILINEAKGTENRLKDTVSPSMVFGDKITACAPLATPVCYVLM